MGAVQGNSAVSSLKHTQVGTQAHVGVSAGDGGPQSKRARPISRKEALRCPGPPSTSSYAPSWSVHTCLFHLTLKATL